VGFGGRGRLIAGKLLDLGLQVVGVYDSNPAKLAGVQFPTFSDLEGLLKLEPDALVITTWPSSHAAIIERALEQGVDVFVEKPMGASLEQSQRIVQAQRRAGRMVVVGYIERLNPAITKLGEVADLSEIVRSREIRIGLMPPTMHEIGVLLDLGSHAIDTAYHLFAKEPVVRSAIMTAEREGEQGEPEYECVIELDFGHVRSSVEARYANIRRRRLELESNHEYFEVTYTPAKLKIGFPPPKLRKHPRNFEDLEQLSKNVETTFDLPKREPIGLMLQLLSESLKKGAVIDPLCNADQALVTARAIDTAKKVATYRFIEKTAQ